MPGDRAKSRERKLKKIQEQWGGQEGQWRKFKRCELCGFLFCVNNYEDRRSRTPKAFGRPICAWCSSHKGRRRMQEHILFERMVAHGCMFSDYDPAPDPEVCKCLFCIARRVKEKWDENDSAG